MNEERRGIEGSVGAWRDESNPVLSLSPRETSLLILLILTLSTGCDHQGKRPQEQEEAQKLTRGQVSASPLPEGHLVGDVLALSPWRPLPLKFTQDLKRSIDRAPTPELTTAEGLKITQVLESMWVSVDSPQGRTPSLPESARFCITTSRDVYLAHQQNMSPALRFTPPLASAHYLTLFLFDLDAPYDERSAVWRGPAPRWVNTARLEEVAQLEISRAPLLLWAMNDLSRVARELPSGLGGRGLALRGKSSRAVRVGRAWLNDYSTWFTSQAVAGDYFGYDGPCVAWNDPQKRHRILALSLASEEDPAPADLTLSGWRLLQSALQTSKLYAVGRWISEPSTSETSAHQVLTIQPTHTLSSSSDKESL